MMAKTPVLAPTITTWINVEILDEPVIPGNSVETPIEVPASE